MTLSNDQTVETTTQKSSAGADPALTSYLAENPKSLCVVGINGGWYDVTSFRSKHPGGATLLEKCHGKDATEMFRAFHGRDVLRGWRPVAKFQPKDFDPAVKAFQALHEEFIREGFFDNSLQWYSLKFLATFAILASAMLCLYLPATVTPTIAIIGGLLYGAFWQQCGFLMHDLMHAEMTHNRSIDRWVGLVFGSFFLGISAHWWRDEHFEHHAFTNVIDLEEKYFDPQMREEVWAQDAKLFPLFVHRGHPLIDFGQYVFIRFQHLFWIPICLFFGRIAITIDGWVRERRWYEIAAQVAHTTSTMLVLYYLLPTWQLRALTYGVAALYEGVLHVQLLLSHYAKPWMNMDELMTTTSWTRLQATCNINIKNPIWMDWFHGGLNFHVEHHLYPLMPRNRFREASFRIKEVCAAQGILYDECTFTEAVTRTLKHLYDVALQYRVYVDASAAIDKKLR